MDDGHRQFGGTAGATAGWAAVRGRVLRAVRWAVVATAGATAAVLLATSADGGGGGRSAPIMVTVPGESYPPASTTEASAGPLPLPLPLPGCVGRGTTEPPGFEAPHPRTVAARPEPAERPTDQPADCE
ncbi:hypothetical protein ACFP3U_26015 [Kitasatospora misakiensis]|uniref:Uncharacterized protein n=1 Tax=Kitasatospora misakiensis TaxID=67330 RepID=A0ABW0XBK4_9ACTN